MATRTVVRRATSDNLRADFARLDLYPVLDTLHPGLRTALARRMAAADPKALYAVPYAVAYATEMIAAHALLNEAADAVQKDDEEFARLPAQPLARSSVERLRVRRRRLGDEPLQEPQRADRRLRDL